MAKLLRPAELTVFACYFGRLELLLGLPRLSPCPWASALLQRHLCCSASDALDRHRIREAMLAQRSGRQIAMLECRGAAPDHPVSASCLEGEYLKCIIARVA